MKKIGLILALLGSLSTVQGLDVARWQQLFREPATVPADLLEKTFLLVRQAIPEENSDSANARQAVKTAQAFLLVQKDDPVALVLEATGRSVMARNSSNFFERIDQVGQALSLLDRAVLLSQGKDTEWLVRLFRGSTFGYLPEFFQKQKIAESDLAWSLAAIKGNSDLKSLVPVVLFYQGEIAGRQHRDTEAHQLWKQGLAEAASNGLPESIYEVRKARDRLER